MEHRESSRGGAPRHLSKHIGGFLVFRASRQPRPRNPEPLKGNNSPWLRSQSKHLHTASFANSLPRTKAYQICQFSIVNPGTRWNSSRLAVTSVRSNVCTVLPERSAAVRRSEPARRYLPFQKFLIAPMSISVTVFASSCGGHPSATTSLELVVFSTLFNALSSLLIS